MLDLNTQTASVLPECRSEVYADTQVVTIGPHRFFRTGNPQEQEVIAVSEAGLLVEHTALQCIASDQYSQLSAIVIPVESVQSSRVYFRAEQFPDFYYVEMQRVGDNFVGILPKPSPDTEQVIYYVEAVDLDFNNAQTPEAAPKVADAESCERDDPGAIYYTGDSPNIVVGAVTAGAPAVPLGFQATGITGFISASGVVSGVAASAAGSASAAAAGAAVGAAAGAASGVAASTVIIVTGAAAAGTAVAIDATKQDEASSPVQH
jgi:hypothetical protein